MLLFKHIDECMFKLKVVVWTFIFGARKLFNNKGLSDLDTKKSISIARKV